MERVRGTMKDTRDCQFKIVDLIVEIMRKLPSAYGSANHSKDRIARLESSREREVKIKSYRNMMKEFSLNPFNLVIKSSGGKILKNNVILEDRTNCETK